MGSCGGGGGSSFQQEHLISRGLGAVPPLKTASTDNNNPNEPNVCEATEAHTTGHKDVRCMPGQSFSAPSPDLGLINEHLAITLEIKNFIYEGMHQG